MLPEYLAKASPNPRGNRAPWYANTAPTYAGIFLWVAFYKAMAGATIAHGSLARVRSPVKGLLSPSSGGQARGKPARTLPVRAAMRSRSSGPRRLRRPPSSGGT